MNNKEIIFDYISMQSYGQAIQGIDNALINEPDRAYYIYLKSFCYYKSGNYLKAIIFAKQSIEKGIREDEACLILGESYDAMGWSEYSGQYYNRGLKVNPDNVEIKAAYAYLLLKLEQTEKAYNGMLEAIKAAPNNCIVLHYAICFYLEKNNEKNSKYKLLEKYIENNGNQQIIFVVTGRKDLLRYRYKKAFDSFKKAYELDEDNNTIADLLEELCLKMKKIYKPIVFIDFLGGWKGWRYALISIFLLMIINLPYISIILILWLTIGIYKLFIDSVYFDKLLIR